MSTTPTISFDLLGNARDSLQNAVSVLTSPDGVNSGSYKQAVLSVAHTAELILKERLRRTHPAFVWENVDKYPSLQARTVSTGRALSRLEAVAGIQFKPEDKATLSACRVIRNAIEHYEFTISKKEAKVLLGKMFSFIFDFGVHELDTDLDEDFKHDDTWEVLLVDLYEFAEAHGERLAARMADLGIPIDECAHCGQPTVDLNWESCKLCGHLWDPERDRDDDAEW